jgi:superfamily II DNA or RNA helicase
MLSLEDIKKDAQIQGIEPNQIVRIVTTEFVGENALTVYYKDSRGRLSERMLYRSDEPNLSIAKEGRPWALDAPPNEFKLGLEAFRINLAHLFDPMMAIHSSNVEPLPHQISAVYEDMLPRQPLRYVLADDPGAGKTIMAGLLIRELMIRADSQRILIVAPGGLVEQWQDELYEKFCVEFTIFTKELDNVSRSGNPFEENNLLIARIDQLSRNEELKEKLGNTQWDLVIVDEAHKMSASFGGQKVNETKRFKLGKLLGSKTRHFLLMTATPHNGKEEDFQLFLSLLDEDRFYGKFREGVHKVDVSDLMGRMIKEDLLKFDGTPLFPERKAYTVSYELSDLEAKLYANVTDYVKEQFNLAEKLDGKRKGNIGFALTLLQRRLASSPEAIYQSINRRHKRLQKRLEEANIVQRGHQVADTISSVDIQIDLPENFEEIDDELSSGEFEELSDIFTDQATAAQTIRELEKEITILKGLEKESRSVVHSGQDKKWEELSSILQDRPEMRNEAGQRRKIIIFTEHRDTLNYLQDKIVGLMGKEEAVITIHGGVNRDDRRKNQDQFRQNPNVIILLATDAAGEGVNLQNANLMINYDLPWNPNRLEQRFGRIHRIGQTEVCHLWNIVAKGTREGDVFQRLFEKLEVESRALKGRVFDILGDAFEGISLKDLLIEAVRWGEQPEIREKLFRVIDDTINHEHFKKLLERNALSEQHMSVEQLYSVKEEMEKAQARKLQPYFISAFFLESFQSLKGELRSREAGRYEIKHVPAVIRERDRMIGETRSAVLKQYERVCFEKEFIKIQGKPDADLMQPGHPLMASVTDLVLEAHRSKLKQGAILVDPTDESDEPRMLFMIDHSVKEGSFDSLKTISRRLQFVSINQKGDVSFAGWAPHLDLRSLEPDEEKLSEDIIKSDWIKKDLENLAISYAVEHLANVHYQETKERRLKYVEKTLNAVHKRLTKEIKFWQDRYLNLQDGVSAGKQPRMQPEMARRRVDELTVRLESRSKALEEKKNIVSSTPVVIGGALVIPYGLLAERKGDSEFSADAKSRAEIERIAMDAVKMSEEAMGNHVIDVSADKCGWDITSRPPKTDGPLKEDRHIEVKGRSKDQTTITVSRNEILYGLNQKEKFLLAIVLVDGKHYEGPFYLREPFSKEPDFGIASANYDLKALLSKAVSPQLS